MQTRPSMMLVIVLAAGALAFSTVPTLVPDDLKLYMRNDGTGCPGNRFLSAEAGASEPGCGYVGGTPFGELYHAGLWGTSTVKDYTTQGGTPQLLDAARDLTGNNRVVATSATNRMAAGQIRVDVTVVATRRSNGQPLTLGAASGETIINPANSAEVDLPFTIDVPDDLDKVEISDVTVRVDIRGWHVLTGYHRLNGQSFVNLPIYRVEDDEA